MNHVVSGLGTLASVLLVATPGLAQDRVITFNDPAALAGLEVSGPVSLDPAKDRQGRDGGSLKVGPGGRVVLRLREEGASGKVELWVWDDGAAPADPKTYAAGAMWGVTQPDGPVQAVGAIYAPYLSGATTYAIGDYDPRQNECPWQKVQYLGVRREAAWHRWTFDLDPDTGLRLLYDDADVNARHPQFNWNMTRLLGFNGVLIEGDASGTGQTVWIDDMAVHLGPPMKASPLWPPPPPADFAVVPPRGQQTSTAYERWANGPGRDDTCFPIAVWLQDPKNAAAYKAAGFNLYVGLWKGPTEAQLAALKAAGMPVVCDQNAVGLAHRDDSLIVAWMHGDEPDNAQTFKDYWQADVEKIKQAWPEVGAFQALGPDKPYRGYGPPVPPKWIVRDYGEIRAKDPSRPVLLNLGQGVAWEKYIGRGERSGKLEDYAEYLNGCDIGSFDIYPAVHADAAVHGSLWYVPRGVARLRDWCADGKVIWNCIECTRISNVNVKPTPAQVRTEVWMSIIHGSRGLIYFVHQFKPTFIEAALLADEAMTAAVTAINAQVRGLAPVINSAVVADGATVSSSNALVPVHLTVRRHGGATYVFAASMYKQDTTARFRVRDVGRTTAEVLGEDRTVEVADGTFSDAFTGYAVHLYRIR